MVNNDCKTQKVFRCAWRRKYFFKKHFFDRVKERPISESLIIKYLKKTETLLKVELLSSTRVKEEKFKLWFKLSNRYSLVVIVAIKGKDLYIITAWNSDRKWQKSIQK